MTTANTCNAHDAIPLTVASLRQQKVHSANDSVVS